MSALPPLRLRDYTSIDVDAAALLEGVLTFVLIGPNRAAEEAWCALKTLRPDVVAVCPRLHDLFADQALAWVGLWPHANLLTAHGVTHIAGRLYLVLDFAAGGSLRDQLNRATPIPFARRLLWAQHIAAGLVALHAPDEEFLRVVPLTHGDLRPENVLVEEHGYAWLADMGMPGEVARVLRETPDAVDRVAANGVEIEAAARAGRVHARLTRRGSWGAAAYLAPERWAGASGREGEGEGKHADPAADIYAFGLILSELLAGRHALADIEERLDEEDWYRLHTSGVPRPLRTGDAEGAGSLPESAEALYRRLLAKRPEERPTAVEAVDALQDVAARVGVEPYRPPNVHPRSDSNRFMQWHNLATAHLRLGRHDEALACSARALALDPDDAYALITRGSILAELGVAAREAGREDEARQLLEAALQCCDRGLMVAPPEDGERRRGLSSARAGRLAQLGRYAEADAEYAEALRLGPESVPTWNGRALNALAWGQAAAAAGRRDEARWVWHDALHALDQARRQGVDASHLRAQLEQALADPTNPPDPADPHAPR